ncbi:MAG: 50S ribosomal protein L25 [Parcubacteria group bacterium GW2011_GWF2_44_8]|nr:MAG: 50S ribosomal protein L25 [Parcubacteria group bacterium GW2011_GWF2_44_8]
MTVILPIQPRSKSLEAKTADQIAAVVYGPKFAATSISVNKKEFEKTFKTAGESTIIELQGLEAPVQVLVKEVVFSPIKGGIVHVDFYVIEKGKEMATHVPLHFIGEAPVTKLGAVINKVLHEVHITCKPADLPSHIDVDLEVLAALEDTIHVSDIKCPKGVKITDDETVMVALVEVIKEEVVEEAPMSVEDIEVEKKGKTEEEEAAA